MGAHAIGAEAVGGRGQHQCHAAHHNGADIKRMGVCVDHAIRFPFAHQHFVKTFFNGHSGEFFKCDCHGVTSFINQDDQSSIIFRHKGSANATW